MRKVYDYKDVRKLEESTIAENIAAGTVVTATAALANAITGYYRNYDVIDIHSFVSALATKWEKGAKDVKNYIQLRNIISEYSFENNLETKEATYLQRNAFDMWNAIKLLEEADVSPSDFQTNESQPVDHFMKIWDRFQKTNDCIADLRLSFYNMENNPSLVIEKLSENKFENVDKLSKDFYLIGFYFVTPIQERIFDVLEKAGFNLHFLNCHDSSYDFATEIWTKTFEDYYKNGDVTDIQPNIKLANDFGNVVIGKDIKNKINLVKHYSTFEFAEYVKNAFDKEEQIYTPDAKNGEKILMEFFPQLYNKKHLLAYPVGQYVYYLHMLRDSMRNTLYYDYEYVKKCFASGWLIIDDVNGNEYNYEMGILEPFFKGCFTIESWKDRLNKLIEAKKITSLFDDREKGQEKWHQLLGNPLLNVGVFNISLDKIENINKLFNKLVDDVNELFPEGEKTDLYEHFSRIRKLINEHKDSMDLLEDEKEAAEELIRQLSNEEAKGMICPLNNVRDAITLLIGNKFDAYETFDDETSDKATMVSSLSLVEAAMMSNYGQRLHLVLADEFSLPGSAKTLPWPLTNELLDNLDLNNNENAQRYVKSMRSVIDNRPLSFRYLFYSLMGVFNDDNKPEITIEWVCKKENKDIDMSPYLKLLSLNPIDHNLGFDESIKNEIAETTTAKVKNVFEMKEDLPDVAKMDYLLCRNRYIYSYALNKLPYFTSEFQYGFLLTKLISSFTEVSECMDKVQIAEKLKDLFPFFRRIELHQSTDFAANVTGRNDKLKVKTEDKISYPDDYYLVHYLNDFVQKDALSNFDSYKEKGTKDFKINYDTCLYCPYSDMCMERHKEGNENE